MSQLTIHNNCSVPIVVKVPGKGLRFVDPGKSAFSREHGDYNITISSSVDPDILGQFSATFTDVDIFVTDVGSGLGVQNNNKKVAVIKYGSHEDRLAQGEFKNFDDLGNYQMAFNETAIINANFPSDVINTTIQLK